MAIEPDITPVRALEATRIASVSGPLRYTPTPVAAAFRTLLTAMAAHIEAERDIEDVDIWDPAFRCWLTDAEETFATMTAALQVLARLTARRNEDKPLLRLADMIAELIGAETDGDVRAAHARLPHLEDLLCPGCGSVVMRVNRMLLTGFQRLREIAALEPYALCDDGPGNGCEDRLAPDRSMEPA